MFKSVKQLLVQKSRNTQATLKKSGFPKKSDLFNCIFEWCRNFRFYALAIPIAMLELLPITLWANDFCNSSECNYSVSLDRAGAYIAVVTLPSGQAEGLCSLLINPSSSYPRYLNGFWAGSILKEQGELPSWIGFSLSQTQSINIIPSDWTGSGVALSVQIDKDTGFANRALVYGPTLMTPGQKYVTQPLKPGFYITGLLSQPDSPRTYFGLAVEGNSLYGGVSGGWLDSSTGSNYGAFIIDSPTVMKFSVRFGDTTPGLGAGKPHLEIYAQSEDGTRELYWSAPATPVQNPTSPTTEEQTQPTTDEDDTPSVQILPSLVHPQKGNAVLLTTEAKQNWNMLTQFSGGVSVAGGDFVANGIATHFQDVLVRAEIEVPPEHVAQKADLLFIIGMEAQPAPYDEGTDTTYSTVSRSHSFYPLDWHIPADEQQPVKMHVPAEGWQPELITAYNRDVTLQEAMQVDFQHAQFTVPGMYYFFVGYRLGNGDIIYNPMPIKLEVQAGEQPYFPGIVQIVATNVDSVSLAWLPASDNKTPANAINYEIHLSDQPHFEPTANTLHSSVVGVNQTDLVGLTTASTSNLLVVAVDEEGNRSKERDYRIARTFSKPSVVSSTTQFAQDKQLGLGEATTQDGVVFTYPAATPGVQPEIGSILFANAGEDVYLRKVDSVENTAQGLVVRTSDGELAEILETGTIDSQITLFDVSKVAPRIGSRTGVRTSRSLRTDGSSHYVMRWPKDTLVAKQENYAYVNGNQRTRADKNFCEATPSVKFEPALDIHTSWEEEAKPLIPKLTSGHVIARGTLSVELDLTCDFGASGSFEKDFVLFVNRSTQTYPVPPIPPPFVVVQDTILSVKVELSAKATAAIKAKLTPTASASIEIGARFNPATEQWEAIPMSPAFKMSLSEKTVDDVFDAGGFLEAEVRVIPSLQVRFFKVIGPELSVEPFAKAEIKYEPVPQADILQSFGYEPVHPTQLDAYLQAQAFVGVSTAVFSKKLRQFLKTQVWESPKWMLFSLPELNLQDASGEVNKSITLRATTTNGKNNSFDDGSIRWDAYSPEKASVSGSKTGRFTASEEGTYSVFFSGHSKLPEPLGRQFVVANVNVGPEEEEPEEPKKPEGGEASSNGDPHLYTFDDLAYDFQAVGEFILAKSSVPNDSFEVQIRQKAWKQRNDVAITQAAAMNVAGDKVGFYLKQKPVSSINGIPQELPQGSTPLPQGGNIVRRGSLYNVVWPNGNGLVEVKDNNYGFLVSSYISKDQKGQIIGLLGNADGDPNNDIVMRDGMNLGTELSFETLYPNYADSWRVTQEESLFDYAEDESTEFFTDRDFPRILSKSTGLDAAARAAAEQICRDAGITNPVLLEDCILDVALTGEAGFAQIPADLANPQTTANVAAPPAPTLGTPGFGQLKGTIYDALTKQVVNNAQVKFYFDGVETSATTTANGIYESDVVPIGNYHLTIEAEGYIAEKAFQISVNEAEWQEVDAIYLVPITHQGMGNITGTVKNDLDKTELPNITVFASRYINRDDTRYGEFGGYTTTDSRGKFTLENLSAGNYTLQFFGQLEEGNYISHEITALSIGGQTTMADISIMPDLNALFRIVVSWSNTPYDLDAHLTGPNREGGRFHIYFANQGSDKWQEPYARLDRDDRDGLGPEIITIDRLNFGEVYRFSVHDYKNGGSTSNNALAQSGAKVDVYSRDGFVSFNVPNQEGTLWTVFEIDESGVIKPVNTMGYEVNQGGIRSKGGIRSRGIGSVLQKQVATDYWPIVFQATKP